MIEQTDLMIYRQLSTERDAKTCVSWSSLDVVRPVRIRTFPLDLFRLAHSSMGTIT